MTHVVTETIAAVMSARPVLVGPEMTVAEAFDTMEHHGIATCPVVAADGELRGMVSRVDLLRALRPSRELEVFGAEAVGKVPVREVMRRGVVTVEAEDPIVAAVDLFVDTRLHALPVVRRGAGPPVVIGVVTQGDALRYLMRAPAATRG
jgi:CBS domain-containing membrane protein